MKVKKVIEQIEHIFGRQPEGYMMQLINDALLDIGSTKQHLLEDVKMDLVEDKRWYELEDNMIDITRVEIYSTATQGTCSVSGYTTKTSCEDNGGTWTEGTGRYTMIPRLADSHKLLKGDDY